jgi:hypothetical protein
MWKNQNQKKEVMLFIDKASKILFGKIWPKTNFNYKKTFLKEIKYGCERYEGEKS